MVRQEEIELLTRQMRAALLNRPMTSERKTQSEALQELQEAIEYMAGCLQETRQFLDALCAGQLDTEPPGRHNFIAGNLKELHSILRHLTWQTAQVASGDYSQKVRFLGAFSDSFNLMTSQLKEREERLSAKSRALKESMDLLKSVLDGQRDWVLVTDAEQRQVIYANLSAKRKFYDPDQARAACADFGALLELLIDSEVEQGELKELEYACRERSTRLLVRSFPIEWNERRAFVHRIMDVTDEREEQEQLHDMAYKDTLTGIYNRRYCEEKLCLLLERGTPFTMVLVDLDGLKLVNDSLGHLSGDDYINTVVEAIGGLVRSDDRLCRMGGDEFLLILPMCSEKNAEWKLQHICAQLAEVDKPYPLSISYGILSVGEDTSAEPEELLRLVDEKMYAMKQTHRSKADK